LQRTAIVLELDIICEKLVTQLRDKSLDKKFTFESLVHPLVLFSEIIPTLGSDIQKLFDGNEGVEKQDRKIDVLFQWFGARANQEGNDTFSKQELANSGTPHSPPFRNVHGWPGCIPGGGTNISPSYC
jgi:hypothetical protein